MRQGQQHRRGRGRHNNNNNNNGGGHRKGQNPLTRSFESNGPDVKVRGTPAHIAEKYISLARDAQSSGDPVLAENYLQHAEHYNRIILAYREQNMPQGGDTGNGHHRMRPPGETIDGEEFGDDDGSSMTGEDFGQSEQPMVTRFPNEPMGQGEGGAPRHSEGGQQPHGGHGGHRDHGGRQQRHEQHGRYRDRYERHDRQPYQDRQGGGERQERHERHDRFRDRQDRYGDRRERYQGQQQPSYQPQERTTEQPAFVERPVETAQPAPQLVQPPLPMPPPAPPRERQADEAPGGDPVVVANVRGEGAPAPRRRERFGSPGNEQPEFLKRSVRRPRKEPETSGAEAAPQAAADEPPAE